MSALGCSVIGMELVEMRPAWSMSGSQQLATLDAVQSTIASLQTYSLQLMAELEKSGYAKEIGARDTVRLLSFRHRRDAKEVRRELKLATKLSKYPAIAAALPDPQADPLADALVEEPAVLLHPAQAEAIVSALAQVPDTVPVDDLVVAEEQMIQAARHLSPSDLRSLGKKVRDTLDADGLEPAEEKAARREKLWLKNADQGVEFGGFLANENAELLRTLIHAGAKPHKTVDGQPDPRSRDKRQADALVVVLELAAGSNGIPGRPRLVVTIDYADLCDATAGATSDVVFGDGLSAAAVRRLACDAGVIPIVLGSNSQPLDVGREERFVTSAIRTALIKRDGGCVICKAPPPNCHAHHLVPWYEGGNTSLDNLVLLCGANHADVHAGHWTIGIAHGVVHVSRPTWAEPSPGSRLNLRPNRPSSATDPQRPSTPWPWTGDNTWPTSAESTALNAWGDDPNPEATTRILRHPTNNLAPGSPRAADNATSAQGP
ncbi:HNH endonuclease [Kribbella sp. VKM Ac-2568]|nr:HNH endonuclease [Kribbella sp. VKM Ac-2568]